MSDESLEEFYGQLLGLEDPWTVEKVIRDGKNQEVRVLVARTDPSVGKCPTCGKELPVHDSRKRRWRHLDSCNYKTIIEAEVPRVNCPEHGVHQERTPWSEKNSRFTLEFERQVCLWLRDAPISAVAFMFGLSWDAVSGIQGRAVKRGLARRQKATPENIGIDETSYQKRHEYVTVILDKDNNTVLDVLQDRKADTLDNWFQTQGMVDFSALKSISMDMWDAFISAVKANIKDAENLIAFDRYHVAQHLNKAVDKVRAQEHRELLEEYGTSELKGTKYEWLRNSSSIDNRTGGRPAFLQLSRMNLKTARAWRIKEMASQLWDFVYENVAEKRWRELLAWMSRSKLDPIIKAGRTIKSYFWGIMNAIRLKANNAMVESMNSGIQRIKRMACGFRNRERFRMAILFHFGGLDLSY
jgi:transposase